MNCEFMNVIFQVNITDSVLEILGESYIMLVLS